jgi:putative oxidoreductase
LPGGGLLTVLGLGGPIGPGLLAGDLVVVTIAAHWPQGFWASGVGGKVGWEFQVPLLAGALAIAVAGNGAWSLDRLLGLVYPDWLLPAWLVLMAGGAVGALAVRLDASAEGGPVLTRWNEIPSADSAVS